VFGADEPVRLLARQVLLLYAAIQVVDALATVAIGSLMGAGDTRFVMILSVGTAWLVKLPVASLLVFGLGMGVLGAWLGMTAEIVALMAFALWRVRGRAWLDHGEPEPEARPATAK
jgi:Na+-driven multidrug efflux pump